MPRTNGIYTLPAGTEAITGTTISSTKYNLAMSDLEAEMNAPQPVSAGGTGVTTISALKAALGVTISDVSGLTGQLSSKLSSALVSSTALTLLDDTTIPAMRATLGLGTLATQSSMAIGGVTGLQAALNAKAETSHTHTVANVTGLQAALDAKGSAVAVTALNDTTAGISNVRQQGAVPYDGTTDVAAFQATIDALPAVLGPHVVNVPGGPYTGNFGGLADGGRNVIWHSLGHVVYSGTRPPGWHMNTDWRGDRRPWMTGGWGFARDVDTGTPRATVDVRRITDHTGGTFGNVHSALSVNTLVQTNTTNYENALTAVLEETVPQTSAPNHCAFQAEARRKAAAVGSPSLVFGANILAKDETVAASSVSGGGIIGLEVNVAARGLDDSNNRIVIDMIPKCFGQAGTMESYAGLRLKGSTTGGVTTMKRGISLEFGGGDIKRGIHVEASNEAIYVNGAPSAVFDTLVTNAAFARFGSSRKTAGDQVAVVALAGHNAADARVSYGAITGTVVTAGSGSEAGALSLNCMIGGALTNALTVSGGAPANPVSMRIDSTLKPVTQGAADSGGSGFRVLRVPN